MKSANKFAIVLPSDEWANVARSSLDDKLAIEYKVVLPFECEGSHLRGCLVVLVAHKPKTFHLTVVVCHNLTKDSTQG